MNITSSLTGAWKIISFRQTTYPPVSSPDTTINFSRGENKRFFRPFYFPVFFLSRPFPPAAVGFEKLRNLYGHANCLDFSDVTSIHVYMSVKVESEFVYKERVIL